MHLNNNVANDTDSSMVLSAGLYRQESQVTRANAEGDDQEGPTVSKVTFSEPTG